MRAGTRWGVMAGCAATPFTMQLFYGYQPDTFGPATQWLAVAAPIVLWLTVETATRIRRRARWLSQALAPIGLAASAGWGWWLYGLLASGHVPMPSRVVMPTVGVAIYTGAAIASGLFLSRKPTTTAAATEPIEAATG